MIREALAADRAAVRELCRTTLLLQDTRDEAGLERLIWTPMHMDPVGLVAEQDGELTGFIAGSTFPDDAATGYVTLVAVRQDRRRQGVGRSLVEALERCLAATGVGEIWAGGSQPNYWWPGVDHRYESTRDLFVSAGYLIVEEALNMGVELSSSLLDEPRVEGVTLRRLDSGEFSRFQLWVRQSWDEVWDRELELTLLRDPISCFVAEEHGQYIGFAAYDTNRLDCFGPMGSAVRARGRGVGGALLRLCLRDYYLRGERGCEISWVGPQKFYRDAVSAEPGRAFDRLRKVLVQ